MNLVAAEATRLTSFWPAAKPLEKAELRTPALLFLTLPGGFVMDYLINLRNTMNTLLAPAAAVPTPARIFPRPLHYLRALVALGGGLTALNAAEANLALVATPTTSYVSGHETITALNDGFTPAHSDDKSHGAYGNWPRTGAQWVQYEWSLPISTRKMEVYWFDDRRGVRLPKACRLKYWDGTAFVPVEATGLGLERDKFNVTTFPEITTTKLRLEFDGDTTFSTGLIEWRVYDSGKSPNFPPTVEAGVDRVVVLPGQTWLDGRVKDDGKVNPAPTVCWSKASGPGTVTFADPNSAATTARFSKPGAYALKLTANDGQASASATLKVTVEPTPPKTHLHWLNTTSYQITSPFWRSRAKNLIINWIPHCIQKLEDPKTPEGGIENFAQAASKLAGKPARHTGPVFANGWVYNTFESAGRNPTAISTRSTPFKATSAGAIGPTTKATWPAIFWRPPLPIT
jgi:hypothetical protein